MAYCPAGMARRRMRSAAMRVSSQSLPAATTGVAAIAGRAVITTPGNAIADGGAAGAAALDESGFSIGVSPTVRPSAADASPARPVEAAIKPTTVGDTAGLGYAAPTTRATPARRTAAKPLKTP